MYKVYKHTTPDGKVYIGCTSKSLKERSRLRGQGYWGQPRFWNAIVHFGWETITSEILAEFDNEQQAQLAEEMYISKFNSTNPEFGYNTKAGSNFSKIEEKRMKLAKKSENNTSHLGKKHTDETRVLLREYSLGNKNAKGNKSVTGKIAISKEGLGMTWIEPGELDLYQDAGWVKGRSSANKQKCASVQAGRVWISKEGFKSKRVRSELLESYYNDGWHRGRK